VSFERRDGVLATKTLMILIRARGGGGPLKMAKKTKKTELLCLRTRVSGLSDFLIILMD